MGEITLMSIKPSPTWGVKFNIGWAGARDQQWLHDILTQAFAECYKQGRVDMREEIKAAQDKLNFLIGAK